MTLACFHSDGIDWLLIAPLNIFVKEFAITGEGIGIIFAGILSIPVDLRGFKDKSHL